MDISLLLILVVSIILIVFFMYVEPRLAKQKIKNSNEYGSARFSTFKEIEKNFIKEDISSIKETGFPVWFSDDNKYVWFDMETPHYVYLGSTGSGKSVTAVIPTCSFNAIAEKKKSIFITDPKGEIYHTTSQQFKDNGYDIYTIDFRHPELSNKINLLEPIIKEYEEYMKNESEVIKLKNKKGKKVLEYQNNAMKHLAETNRLITSLSATIMSEKTQEKDPFWNNSARSLLEGIIGFYLEEYKNKKIKREQITLTSIKKFQTSFMEEENFELFKNYVNSKPYGTKSKDSLTSILSAAENTYKSITATFGEKMALFDDINVANITSKSEFAFDCLGKKPTVIYVIVPDEDKTYYSLITIIVGLLYRELVKLANAQESKKLPVQIDWILDEFANCPPLNDIEAIVSVARSRGMHFHFFIQSLSQLDNIYGKEVSQIILDNCGLIYLKTNTQETAEAISKRLGKKTIESNSIIQSLSLNKYDGNKSVSLMGRDLMTPEEVKQLHYKTIIFPIIGFPIFRDTVIYTKFICYKKGEVIRKPKMLENLSDTYFTVDNLKKDYPKQKVKSELTEFYELCKKNFTFVNKDVIKILEGQDYEISYPVENDNLYCCFKVNNIVSQDDIQNIKLLEEQGFHIEVKIEEKLSFINIHKML